MRKVLTVSLLIVVLAVVGLLTACSDGSDTTTEVVERQHYPNEIVFAKEMSGWTKPSDGYEINIIIREEFYYYGVTAYKVENGTLYFITENLISEYTIGITAVENALIEIEKKS